MLFLIKSLFRYETPSMPLLLFLQSRFLVEYSEIGDTLNKKTNMALKRHHLS